jgi:hypothetical protein
MLLQLLLLKLLLLLLLHLATQARALKQQQKLFLSRSC